MKSSFPYLVDISVGNFCPFGCPMCYTSSTTKGTYADSYFLGSHLSDVLLKSNVFNVVFGGGEPTLYNDKYTGFDYLLSHYKNKNFVIGVTTRNYDYWKKDTFKREIEQIDSVAISGSSLEDLKKIKVLSEKIRETNYTCKVYVQTILGLEPYDKLKKFLMTAKESYLNNITILGYKNFGFGENITPFEIPDDWISFVKELGINIGIDSILVKKYRQKLIDKRVPKYYLVGAEGESSCYIDALKQVIKPSSFTDVEFPMINKNENIYKFDSKRFLDIFSKF